MGFNLKEAVTLAIALLGAVLGMLNAWRNWNMDRVRVRVRITWAITAGGNCLCFDVVNLSNFPVSVTHFGFDKADGTHMQFLPIFTNGERLPVRLESRTRCTGMAAPGAHQGGQFATVTTAYIQTACGLKIKGDGAALRQVVMAALAAHQ